MRVRAYLWAISLLLAGGIAGCVGGEPVDVTAADDAAEGSGEAGLATDAAGVPDAGADVPADAPAPPPIEVPVSFDGRFSTNAQGCAFAFPVAVYACAYTPLPAGEQSTQVDVPGRLDSVSLEATWSASSASNDQLYLQVYVRCGDGCRQYASVSGPSPLVLEWAPPVPVVPEELFVAVFVPSTGTPVGIVSVTTDQDFHVEGRLIATPEPVPVAGVESTTPATPELRPFAFEGTIAADADACAFGPAAYACAGAPGVGSEERFFEVDVAGTLQRLQMTVTWEPTSAGTQDVSVSAYLRCGDGCYQYAYASGGSPLALDWEPVLLVEPEELTVYVSPGGTGTPVGSADVNAEQAFHIEGTAAWLPAPPAGDA